METSSRRRRLALLAIFQPLMVLPAIAFIGAALFQTMGGNGLPARMSWLVSEWFAQIPRFGLALLLLGLPCTGVATGSALLLRTWRTDELLRRDTLGCLAVVRRHIAILVVTMTTLLGAAVAAFLIAHVITD
jgi:hypothetical protein